MDLSMPGRGEKDASNANGNHIRSQEASNVYPNEPVFKVAKGSETAFEQVWLSRDSHLDKVPVEGAAVHYDNEVIEASSDQEAIGKAGAWAASHRLGVVATLIVKQGVRGVHSRKIHLGA